MAKVLGIKTYRFDLPVANQRRAIFTNTELSAGHVQLVDDFTIHIHPSAGGNVAVGDSTVTVETGNATDGVPRVASDFISASQVLPRSSGMADKFDLSKIYVVTDTAGDDVIIEYKAEV